MDPDTIERLELKIAFLEQAAADLSDVVYAQQREIDALRAKLVELTSRVAAAAEKESSYTIEEEKPPHY